MADSDIGKKAEAKIEQWSPVVDNPMYEVSSDGQVRSIDRWVNSKSGSKQFRQGKLLKIHHFSSGYCYVVMQDKNRLVHRLVAQAFIVNPSNKPEVNHLDGNKDNNCYTNLEWATPSENIRHSYLTGLEKPSSPEHMLNMNKAAMLNVKKRVKCIETGQIFNSMKEAAEQLGLWKGAVYEYFNKNRPVGGYTFEKVVMKNV